MTGRLELVIEGVASTGVFVQGEVEVDDLTVWVRAEHDSGWWRYLKVWEHTTGARVATIDVDDDGPYWLIASEYEGEAGS